MAAPASHRAMAPWTGGVTVIDRLPDKKIEARGPGMWTRMGGDANSAIWKFDCAAGVRHGNASQGARARQFKLQERA